MTTRLPQEVYDELGFTHEQFEQAMAAVQELGSNRAADKAMGLATGTVARWARAWLLASRAIEENPQADVREILSGLKLGRRSPGPPGPERPALSRLGDPDSPEAIEALEAFRRGAGLQAVPTPQGELRGASEGRSLETTETLSDSRGMANETPLADGRVLPTITGLAPEIPGGGSAIPEAGGLAGGLLEGLSARTKRSPRILADPSPPIPRSLLEDPDAPIASVPAAEAIAPGPGSRAQEVPELPEPAPGVATVRSEEEALAFDAMQTMLRQIRSEALRPDYVSGLVDRVRQDVLNLSALAQQGQSQSEKQVLDLQKRLESLAEGLRELSGPLGQLAGFSSGFGDELKSSLDSTSAMLHQVIEQQTSVAERLRELLLGQQRAAEGIAPSHVADRMDALLEQVRLLARSTDVALVREQLGGLQRLLEIGAPVVGSATVGTTGGMGEDFPVAQLLASIDSQLARHSSNIQARLEQVYAQTADSAAVLKADLAGRHQIEMLRSELPAQFSTLNVRIEAMLNQQADEIRLQARVPAAVTERLQSQLSDLNYSIGRLLDKGQQESELVVRETKQLFGENKLLFGETQTFFEERLSRSDRGVAELLERGFLESKELISDTRALVESGHRLVVDRTEDLSTARQQIEALQLLVREAAEVAPKSLDMDQVQERLAGLGQQLAGLELQLAGLGQQLSGLDPQVALQVQTLGQMIVERDDAGAERARQLESSLSSQLGTSLAEVFSRLEALGVHSVAGSESLATQLQTLGEQSLGLFAQLESRLPARFLGEWESQFNQLRAQIEGLADRGAADVATVLAELKGALETSRTQLVERTDALLPPLQALAMLPAELARLASNFDALAERGQGESQIARALREETVSRLDRLLQSLDAGTQQTLELVERSVQRSYEDESLIRLRFDRLEELGSGQSEQARLRFDRLEELGSGQSEQARLRLERLEGLASGQSEQARLRFDRLEELGSGQSEQARTLIEAARAQLVERLERAQQLILERTESMVGAARLLEVMRQGLDALGENLKLSDEAAAARSRSQDQLNAEAALNRHAELRGLIEASRALILERSELTAASLAQLGELKAPVAEVLRHLVHLDEGVASIQVGVAQLQSGHAAKSGEISSALMRLEQEQSSKAGQLEFKITTLGDGLTGRAESLGSGLQRVEEKLDRLGERALAIEAARESLQSIQGLLAEAEASSPKLEDLRRLAKDVAQLQSQLGREAQSLNAWMERIQTAAIEHTAELRDELAGKYQIDLLRSDLPAHFTQLSARIEDLLLRHADRSDDADARLPDAIVGRLQGEVLQLGDSLGALIQQGVAESTNLFAEARLLIQASKSLVDERTDLLSLGLSDVGAQLGQMDLKLGGVADRISALLAYLQRGGSEKLAVLIRDAEQKGLRLEQEQREAAQEQGRVLRELRSDLSARLEQIQSTLGQPAETLKLGFASSADALRGVIATGLDSVSTQLSNQNQLANDRIARLLDDVSLTAIRIEQVQQRETAVLRSEFGTLAKELGGDLQTTREALRTNISNSISEVREMGVLQQRSLAEIINQIQEQSATMQQSLIVSLEGLDRSILSHIEKLTGGQAAIRENFAELAKTALAFRRSSEQLTSLSRSVARIERLASDVAGFGGHIQTLSQTAEKLQADNRRSQQLEDQIVRLQASFQVFASSIARIDALGPSIEQLHQEALRQADFNAFIESFDARFQPLATQALVEKSGKLIGSDLQRLQHMSAALQNLIEQHLQRLQVLEITVTQQLAERVEEAIRQQSLLREDLFNRASEQDDLLRQCVNQLLQAVEKATSPLARAELIQQGIAQLRELQVGQFAQLEDLSRQRQREVVELVQDTQTKVLAAEREGLRQLTEAGQDRFSKTIQLVTQTHEKSRELQIQHFELASKAVQLGLEQAAALARRHQESMVSQAETHHQQSELLERDLHEQIQSLQRQHFTILKQLQDQNHNQVQSLQNALQDRTEQLIRQLHAEAQRSQGAEFNDVRQLHEQLSNALSDRFDQSLDQAFARSDRGFMQLEALMPLLDQLRTEMLRPRHIEQVVSDVRRELESLPRNVDMQTLQDRLSARLNVSRDQLASNLMTVKDELSGLVESGNNRLGGLASVTDKLSERSEAAISKLDHLSAALESVRTDTLRTRISDQNIGLERVSNLVTALQERLGSGIDTVLDRVMGLLTQQDKLADRTEDAQSRLQALVALSVEQAVADIRREMQSVIREPGLSAVEERLRSVMIELQNRLVGPSEAAVNLLGDVRVGHDRLGDRIEQSLYRIESIIGLAESMRAEALRPRHLDQVMGELRREFGPLARSNEIDTVSERLRVLGLSTGKVEDQVTRIRAAMQGMETTFGKLDGLSSQIDQFRAEAVREQHIVEAVAHLRRDIEPLVKSGELSSMMVNNLLERLNTVSSSANKLEDRVQRLQSETQMMHSEMTEIRGMLARIESKLER